MLYVLFLYQLIGFLIQCIQYHKSDNKSKDNMNRQNNMEQSQWTNLSKYWYEMSRFTDNELGSRFNHLSHHDLLIAVAPNGGPIAATLDKNKIFSVREQDLSINNLLIFQNDGEISRRIKLEDPMKNIILGLGFLQDQHLLVLFSKGNQWLVDPHSGKIRNYFVYGLSQKQIVVQCKIVQNSYAVYTSFGRFLYVSNPQAPEAREFASCEEELRSLMGVPMWQVYLPKGITQTKFQLHLAHPTYGIVQVIQKQSKKYFFNNQKNPQSRLPNIHSIRYISQPSPNKKYVALLSAEPLYKDNPMDKIPQNLKKKTKKEEVQRIAYAYKYRIYIGPSIMSDIIKPDAFKVIQIPFLKTDIHLTGSGHPLNMCWCGNKAIVIQFRNYELFMISIDGDSVKLLKNESERDLWSYLNQQVDGIRIISKYQNRILRQIPLQYLHVFEALSQHPGSKLYYAYEAFEQQAPLQDDEIRKDKKRLAKAVEECIKASRFELNYQKTIKLMKAAAYGKSFLPPNGVKGNIIFEAVQYLRVVNYLRTKHRYITMDQFVTLTDNQLLTILLRYRQHYFAFELYKYLKKDQAFRVKIFTDWACCKVQNIDETQQQICMKIKTKLENQKGISFTEIAHKCIEIGRNQLAEKLLEFQPSLTKKVPLLLWIGDRELPQNCKKYYERGFEEAIKSKDVNLIFLVIRKMILSQKLDEQQIFELFSRQQTGVHALINYFRLFDGNALIRYYIYLKDYENVVIEFLKRGNQDRKYDHQMKLFEQALNQAKLSQTFHNPYDWRKQAMKKLFEHFKQFRKAYPHIKFKNDKEKPLTIYKQLNIFIAKKNSDAVDDFKSVFDLNDKRVILSQMKCLLDQGKYEDLEKLVERHQKSYKIPVEMFADFLLKKREEKWAMRMIGRMPSKMKKEQYLILNRIGRLREAITLAYDRKDIDALQQMLQTIIEPQLNRECSQKLAILRRK